MPGVAGIVRGKVAAIKWAYYDAAVVEGFTVTRTRENVWAVAATVVLADDYKLAQRPLLFVAPTKLGDWRWPIVSWSIANGTLRAQLGAPLP
jgi:hypothetical protein